MRFHDNLARYGVRALAQLLGLDQSLQDCLLFYRTDRNLPVVAWEDGHCTLQICTPAYGGDYTPPCKLLVPLVHLSSKSDHNADRPQRLRGCVLEPLYYLADSYPNNYRLHSKAPPPILVHHWQIYYLGEYLPYTTGSLDSDNTDDTLVECYCTTVC
jgi:hypothetical protein